MKHWQLQEAKAKLSHLIYLTTTKGPQSITVRGKEEVILLSKKTYDHIVGKKPSLVSFLKSSPLHGLHLNLDRDKSYPRENPDL